MPFKVTLCKPDEEPAVVSEEDMPETPQPVDDLIDAILGRSDALCSAQDGALVVEVVEAAYISAQTGKKVTL